MSKDANEMIPMLEKLMDSIEDNENLQLFITEGKSCYNEY